MYKISGGCEREHKCRQCMWFDEGEKDRRRNIAACMLHPEHETGGWNPEWMACKKFSARKRNPVLPLEDLKVHQMTIEDLLA